MPATLRSLYNRRLTPAGIKEGIRQPLYDHETFTSNATTQLRFFSVPAGQGGKTKADTNMTLASQLPAGWKFIVQTVEVFVYPGATASGYTRKDPVVAAGAVPDFANDVWALAASGWCEIVVGSKPYLTVAPLLMLPPRSGIVVNPAASGTDMNVDYARLAGRPYVLNPVLPLDANTNFEVTLNWPAPLTLPSGNNARIGVVLDGLLFRE